MNKTKYIHIGMPKNLSTTLQRDFFTQHEEILHLGVGVGSNVDYINKEIASACENHFQYSKKYAYNKVKNKISDSFNEQFNKFYNDPNKKACGISLELLSFTFTPDQIDIEDKVERVFDVFGKGTKIILIIREQFKLIESLYKESIKIGYYGTFQEYLEYIYYSRDKNFIFDFNYDYLFDLYSSYFGKENIIVLPIEHYRYQTGELIYNNSNCLLTDVLSKKIGLSSFDANMNHYNKPLSNSELLAMRNLNKINVHGIGNQAYSTGTNFHRLKHYFRNELNIKITDTKLYNDARIKNINIEKSQVNNDPLMEVDFYYPKRIKEYLETLFKESNKEFQKKLDFKLPEQYI